MEQNNIKDASSMPSFENYAIVQIGGKQYQAIPGKTVAVDRLEGQEGEALEFTEVLFRKNGENAFEVGRPFLNTPVQATIIKHTRGKKLVGLRFKRRKKVRVQKNQRQHFTVLRIVAI